MIKNPVILISDIENFTNLVMHYVISKRLLMAIFLNSPRFESFLLRSEYIPNG